MAELSLQAISAPLYSGYRKVSMLVPLTFMDTLLLPMEGLQNWVLL